MAALDAALGRIGAELAMGVADAHLKMSAALAGTAEWAPNADLAGAIAAVEVAVRKIEKTIAEMQMSLALLSELQPTAPLFPQEDVGDGNPSGCF